MTENMECLFDRTADFCGIQKEICSIRHEGTEMDIPEAWKISILILGVYSSSETKCKSWSFPTKGLSFQSSLLF